MSLNIERLENVKNRDLRIVARCPACAEQGHDSKGNHLSVDKQGRFSCVIYPGEPGTSHRKRIFALVGIKDRNGKSYASQQNKMIKVKNVNGNHGNVIKSNVLGRLGRVNQTHAQKEEVDIKDSIYKKDFEKGVPSVPNIEKEIIPISDETLQDIYLKTMHKINDQYLEGTIKFIEKNYPDLDRQIDEVDKQINEIWKECNQGEAVIEDFKGALDSYENLYLKAIDIFKSKSVNFQEKVSI